MSCVLCDKPVCFDLYVCCDHGGVKDNSKQIEQDIERKLLYTQCQLVQCDNQIDWYEDIPKLNHVKTQIITYFNQRFEQFKTKWRSDSANIEINLIPESNEFEYSLSVPYLEPLLIFTKTPNEPFEYEMEVSPDLKVKSFEFERNIYYEYHTKDTIIVETERVIFSQPSMNKLVRIFLEKLGMADENEIDWTQVKKHYYKKAQIVHPDKNSGNTKDFQKLSEIYEALQSFRETKSDEDKWVWYMSNIKGYVTFIDDYIPDSFCIIPNIFDDEIEDIVEMYNECDYLISDLSFEDLQLRKFKLTQSIDKLNISQQFMHNFLKSGYIFIYSPLKIKRYFKNSAMFYTAFFVPYFVKKNMILWWNALPELAKDHLQSKHFDFDLLFGRMKNTIPTKKKQTLLDFLKEITKNRPGYDSIEWVVLEPKRAYLRRRHEEKVAKKKLRLERKKNNL